jgi:hypothetical protein
MRFAVWATGGGVAGVVALLALVARHPAIAMEMDRDAASVVRGLHGPERVGQDTYAWTRGEVRLLLAGLDRRADWTCAVRLRGGRADVSTLPSVTMTVDGVIATTLQTTNEYQDLTTVVPARGGRSGATLTLTASNTFQPGPSDKRVLGVMIDRWTCTPSAAVVIPPARALRSAAAAGAVVGAVVALLATGWCAVAALVLLTAAQAVPLSLGFGMFTGYPDDVALAAVAVGALVSGFVVIRERALGRPLDGPARVVAGVMAAAFFLKLIALIHPSKPPIDVVFHAHRLQWVMEGRYYFTQPMPSGVHFPYAIGLYVFALPWTLLTDDYVLLLRIVVTAAEASGAILLFLLVSRVWGDRVVGAAAAALFPLVPRLLEIVGNANLTNAFGQSVALATVTAAVLWRLGRAARGPVAALTVLTAFALLCHISTITLLTVILLTLAAIYWWAGTADLRAAAVSIVAAVLVAGVFSVAVYYGHFGDAYRSAARVRATTSAPSPPRPGAAPAPPASLVEKSAEAARLSVASVGWPMFLLALPGAAWLLKRRRGDRLTFAIGAWMTTYGLFVLSVVVMPVDRSFQRYAAEFISRVTLATHPAVVVLAAAGAAWLWRGGTFGRAVALILVGACVYVGFTDWYQWIG